MSNTCRDLSTYRYCNAPTVTDSDYCETHAAQYAKDVAAMREALGVIA